MFPFPIEITTYVALFNKEVWINTVLLCSDFRKYAYTEHGKRQFLNLFTKVIKTSK